MALGGQYQQLMGYNNPPGQTMLLYQQYQQQHPQQYQTQQPQCSWQNWRMQDQFGGTKHPKETKIKKTIKAIQQLTLLP